MVEIKYSVIIPHKNSINLLNRCIESIPPKKLIQIIVVDDNSEYSQEQWLAFIKRFDYVTLIRTKEGKGAGYARNVGLKNAVGKWIIFADADDFFYSNAFDTFDDFVKDRDDDIIYFNSDTRDGESLEKIEDRSPISKIRQAIKDSNYDELRYNSCVPWGKIIRKEFIDMHNIWFDEVEACNDILFSTKIGFFANKIGTMENCLYCCTKTEGSLVFAPSPARMLARIDASIRVNEFLDNMGIKGYRANYIPYILFFFPSYPRTFVKLLIKYRYRGHISQYLRDIIDRIALSLKIRIMHLFKR